MKIYVATQVRGFLLDLFKRMDKHKFIFDTKKSYETYSKTKLILHNIAKSRIVSFFGIIRTVKVKNIDADISFSYNKFLSTDKPYVIYLENPYALVNYSTIKTRSSFAKKKLKGLLDDPNLKAIVGLSKAATDTVSKVYDLPNRIKIEHIPPLISNVELSEKFLFERSNRDIIKCLYISSKFTLKGGADILTVFESLKLKDNIKLEIITDVNNIALKYKKIIESNPNITLTNFSLTKEELNEKYKNANILLNPSRMDSYGLVILEAMKFGNVILSTNIYAIPEFVKHNENGLLIEPKYQFFDENNLAYEPVWNNRESTIYSDFLDTNVIAFLTKSIEMFNDDRKKLNEFTLNAYNFANSGIYNDKNILASWDILLKQIEEK